jgi:hypothetical protein
MNLWNIFFWPIISALCDFWIRGYDGILQWKKIPAIRSYAFKVHVIILSKNESIFDFSRSRNTINNWKNKRLLHSHKRYLIFKNGLFFSSTLLEAPTIPLRIPINLKISNLIFLTLHAVTDCPLFKHILNHFD